MKHFITFIMIFSLALAFCLPSSSYSQSMKEFAKKGTFEAGGSISYQSSTFVSGGETSDDALNVFSFQPFFGYFVTDGFEIGVNPFGFTSISYGDESASEGNIFLASSYNFKAGKVTYPFIEALIGYSFSSNGSDRSGFSWGGRGGLKLAVTDKGLLNLAVQYTQITLNKSEDSERSGTNNIAIAAGFTVWF